MGQLVLVLLMFLCILKRLHKRIEAEDLLRGVDIEASQKTTEQADAFEACGDPISSEASH